MFHRSPSAHRKQSRNVSASAYTKTPTSTAIYPSRRASIAVSPIDSRNTLTIETNRSPRHSIIPDISLDSIKCTNEEINLPLTTSVNSLVPSEYASKSPRHSLVPSSTHLKSPRNSVAIDLAQSLQNSVPVDKYNCSPRNSLTPDANRSPRGSLGPETYLKNSRQSLIVDNNVVNFQANLTPDVNLTPRHSLIPDRSEFQFPSQPNSSNFDDYAYNKYRKHSAASTACNSQRTSPRGSLGNENMNDRFFQGNLTAENNDARSHRGSIISKGNLDISGRSPRGSLSLTIQEPLPRERRFSSDNVGSRASLHTSSHKGSGPNMVQSSNSGNESSSRRASSSVSQASGDEQRRLCSHQKLNNTDRGLGINLSLTTYGSVAYQLKDANLEASGTCDFIYKAFLIIHSTVMVTVMIVLLSLLPLLMLIMGVNYLRDCPRESNIPIYMVVGGCFGCAKMWWLLYSQLHNRHTEASVLTAASIGSKILSILLTLFLVGWFILGNYWILRIKWPDFAPTLFEPDRWCHHAFYIFSLVHLYIIYSILGAVVIFVIVLAVCHFFACPWLGPGRFK